MHRRIRLAAAIVAAGVLAAVNVAPVGAQETPPLGLQIDPTRGSPGDEVNGQVDVQDVAAHCTTDLEEFTAQFDELIAIFESTEPGSLVFEYFPGGQIDKFENYEQTAFSLIAATAIGVAHPEDFGLPGSVTEEALAQTFVMTFADIATQEPIGERATFDPAVGAATVAVPEVDPGLWAVAAACVGPSTNLDVIREAISAGAAYLEDLGAPLAPLDLGEELFDFLLENGPALLEPLMVPQALGAQLFCVEDATGACPGDQRPAAPPAAPAAPATPVVARPAFTG